MCWSSESFGSPIEPSNSDSLAFIVSFNRRLTRTCFRRRPCSPNRSHHGFIFRRVGSAAFRIAGITVVSSHNLRKTFACPWRDPNYRLNTETKAVLFRKAAFPAPLSHEGPAAVYRRLQAFTVNACDLWNGQEYLWMAEIGTHRVDRRRGL